MILMFVHYVQGIVTTEFWAQFGLQTHLYLTYFYNIVHWFSIDQSKSNLSRIQVIFLSSLKPR